MTRYYLTRTPSAVTITGWPGWDYTRLDGFPNRFTLAAAKVAGQVPQVRSGAQHPPSSTGAAATSQHVLDTALPAGTVAGTLDAAAVGYRVGTSSVTYRPRLRLAVVSADGTTERGVLLEATHPATIGTYSGYSAHTWAAAPLTPVVAVAGDRLVLTIGTTGTNASTTGTFAALHRDGGEPSTPDIPANLPAGTSTTAMAPWVDITWTTPPDPPTEPEYDRRWWTHRLAVRLGLDPVAVQPVVMVETYDPPADAWTTSPDLSAALVSYSVTYGREDATSSLDPLAASAVFTAARLTAPPTIGTRVRIRLCDPVADALGLDASERVRFTGEVTDSTGDRRRVKATCVGRLGRAYRLTVPAVDLPGDQAHGRVERLLFGTGLALDVGTIDTDPAEVVPADRDAPLSAHVVEVEQSTTGRLVEQPTGRLDWHGPEHRRGVAPALTLTPAELLADPSWSQRLADVVNTVTVSTGSGSVTVTDPVSVDAVTGHGPYPATVSTVLTDATAARGLGSLIVGRRTRPAWHLPALELDLIRTASAAHLPELLRLRHGDRIRLADLPPAVPLPADVFVEGWTETANPRTWRLSVAVTDPLLSGTAVRWVDVPATAAYQWADVAPALTWLDTARVEYPADLI